MCSLDVLGSTEAASEKFQLKNAQGKTYNFLNYVSWPWLVFDTSPRIQKESETHHMVLLLPFSAGFLKLLNLSRHVDTFSRKLVSQLSFLFFRSLWVGNFLRCLIYQGMRGGGLDLKYQGFLWGGGVWDHLVGVMSRGYVASVQHPSHHHSSS